jgi:hypothetical protein
MWSAKWLLKMKDVKCSNGNDRHGIAHPHDCEISSRGRHHCSILFSLKPVMKFNSSDISTSRQVLGAERAGANRAFLLSYIPIYYPAYSASFWQRFWVLVRQNSDSMPRHTVACCVYWRCLVTIFGLPTGNIYWTTLFNRGHITIHNEKFSQFLNINKVGNIRVFKYHYLDSQTFAWNAPILITHSRETDGSIV